MAQSNTLSLGQEFAWPNARQNARKPPRFRTEPPVPRRSGSILKGTRLQLSTRPSQSARSRPGAARLQRKIGYAVHMITAEASLLDRRRVPGLGWRRRAAVASACGGGRWMAPERALSQPCEGGVVRTLGDADPLKAAMVVAEVAAHAFTAEQDRGAAGGILLDPEHPPPQFAKPIARTCTTRPAIISTHISSSGVVDLTPPGMTPRMTPRMTPCPWQAVAEVGSPT